MKRKESKPIEEDDSNEEEQERSCFGAEPEDSEEEISPSRKRSRGRTSTSTARDGYGSPGSQASGCRHDSSLGKLTKDFLGLLERSIDGTVDRNIAADTLKVKKRRIYDITNVLEGVGLLQKQTKNVVQWMGGTGTATTKTQEQQQELDSIQADNSLLVESEKSLDYQISQMSSALESLCNHPVNKERLYITDSLIRSLPCFASDTVFAMRAPSGTTIQLAEPEGDQFMLKVRSSSGVIEVYLVHHAEDIALPAGQQQPAAAAAAMPLPTSLASILAPQLLHQGSNALHLQPLSPALGNKPEPFTPLGGKPDFGFPGASPFGPVSSAFQAFGGNYGEFDVNAWATPTGLSLYEAFRDEEGDLGHNQLTLHQLVA